jgi:PAS domain S-box-containing protein
MRTRFIVFTAMIIMVLWINALLDVRDRRADAIREAEREASTLALTLEEQVRNSLAAADLTLRLIQRMAEENDWTEARADDPAIQAVLQQMTADVSQINNLVITDRDGRFVIQSAGPVNGITAADRAYYLTHRDAPGIMPYISPAVRGKITGRNIITVSRAIIDRAGGFAGIAAASVNADHFHKTYTALNVGPNGTIMLLDVNGAVINRQPGAGTAIGDSMLRYSLFTDHLPQAPTGTYIAASPLDGVVRIFSYRQIAGTPFIVAIGKSLAETLEAWRQGVWRDCLTLGIITLLLIGGCAVLLRETERRQRSQRSLADSERRFRSTFDHAPVGIAQLDLDGRWTMTNSALCEILGYSEDELLQKTFVSLTHNGDIERSRASWQRMLEGKLDSYCIEKRYIRKDGRPIWVSLTASMHGGAATGDKPYVLCILADITSRKATEADLVAKSDQLRQSESVSRKQALIFESIIANMADAVIVVDENHQFVTFNPAARKMVGEPPATGYNAQECIKLFGLYSSENGGPLDPEQAPLRRALQGESVDLAELYVRNASTRDGAFVSVSARPMLDDTGVIRGAVVVCRDITEARHTGEALRQAQKMEAVGQLTGGIAHDFNNLLQVIMGNSEILADVLKSNDTHQKLAQMTLTAAQRGAELTNQLLAFSRRQSLQARPTDVRHLVAETESLLAGALGATIEFRQDFAPDLWQVVVDPGMLQNALVNLVLNARDAMPEGGRLTIQAENFICDQIYSSRHKEVRPGDYVRINISDTGVGIPAANLQKVFEPFFTTKDVGKGSGLGLSMVYGFIQQSGGAITVRSVEDYGTIVRLYLPRAASVAAPRPVTGGKAAPHGSETILVVEDDPLVRDFVVGSLRSLGYAVLATRDGNSALDTLKVYEGPIELLFSDIVMPGGMTGWELAKRAIIFRPTLKILFTSGYTESVDGGSDLGALLAKPYGKTDLATAVRKALRQDKELVD